MNNSINKAMSIAHKAQIDQYGTPISQNQFDDLRNYANLNGVRLSGFRNYVGDTGVIKLVIDDISEIARDFPRILDEKCGIVLELDYDMEDDDFATTDSGHVIHINAALYSNIDVLSKSYSEGVRNGYFVQNTDWRSIIRHEVGHVVDSLYSFDLFDIVSGIVGTTHNTETLSRLRLNLSTYSASYRDGREIISECFSGYYSNAGNVIADAFIKRCIELLETKDKREGDFHEKI